MVSRLPLLLLFAVFSLPAGAGELEGVRMAGRLRIGTTELQLNGMALRTRVFFKVYVAGLYLLEKSSDAAQVIGMPGPKQMTLVMLRDVGADTFAASLLEGLKENTGEAELAKLKPQVDELMAIMQQIGEAKKGMVIALQYAPTPGTQVVVNGKPQGRPIEGEALFRALLRIWLGDKPVSDDMKRAFLGGT